MNTDIRLWSFLLITTERFIFLLLKHPSPVRDPILQPVVYISDFSDTDSEVSKSIEYVSVESFLQVYPYVREL